MKHVCLLAGLMLCLGVTCAAPANSEKKQRDERQALEANSRAIDARGFSHDEFSRLVFYYTNVERLRHGLPEFASWQPLAAAANAHSADMAQRGYFSHTSRKLLRKTTLSDRLAAQGVSGVAAAENIAMMSAIEQRMVQWNSRGGQRQNVGASDTPVTYQQLAHSTVQQWMNSPGHRANILNPSLAYLGVGCAVGYDNNWPYVYVTQNFCGGR